MKAPAVSARGGVTRALPRRGQGLLRSSTMRGDVRLTHVEVEIAKSAEVCFRLICDVERVPQWVPGVALVHVSERGADGRVLVAQFVGMPSRGSFAYSLRYAYDEANLTVTWGAIDQTLRDLQGEAIVTAVGPERCRLRYGLCASTSNVVPGWARTPLREETPGPIAEAFRKWAERQDPGAGAR